LQGIKYHGLVVVGLENGDFTMNKKDFFELTGENPEDILGNDWENIVDEMGEK